MGQRRYYLGERDTIDLLNALRIGDNGSWEWPLIKSEHIPSDAKVVSVRGDWERRAVAVILEHESFEEVTPCQLIPEGDPRMIELEWVKMIRGVDAPTVVFEDEHGRRLWPTHVRHPR